MLQRIYGTAWESEAALKAHLDQLVEAEKRDHRKLANELDLLSFPQRARRRPRGLAPEGRHRPQADGGLQPAAPRARRLRVRLHAAPHQGAAVRDERPPRLVRRRHVPADGDGQRHVLHEADELPDALPDLPVAAAQLPRAAAAAVRARHGVPLRAGRHAARPAAHPRLHAGRQPHLLHAGAAARRDRLAARLRAVGAAGVRLRRVHVQPVDEGSRQVRRHRRGLGRRRPTRCARRSTRHGLEYAVKDGDAAFYGPKIDIDVRDAIGRTWQLSTIQCDFNHPERFDLEYVGADNARHRPIMLHRALFGSVERFFGVLLEHYAGAFPTWLAPVQVRVLPVRRPTRSTPSKVADAAAGGRRPGRRRSAPPTRSASASAAPSWRSSRTCSSSATTTSPPRPSASTAAGQASRLERGVDLGAFVEAPRPTRSSSARPPAPTSGLTTSRCSTTSGTAGGRPT